MTQYSTYASFIEFVNSLIENYRVQIGGRPRVTPVSWSGIDMSVEEAKMVIRELEKQKLLAQESMNNAQTGGEITKLASGSAGLAAMITGAALLMFPPTAIAGAITLASGVGASGLGQMIGDGVQEIGTNHNVQSIHQLDQYIQSIKDAIIASI